jgi:hypothetical protein
MKICVFDTRGTLDFYIALVGCFGGVEHSFAPQQNNHMSGR